MNIDWVSFFLGIVGSIIATFIVYLFISLRKIKYRILDTKLQKTNLYNYDPEIDNLFCLHKWSFRRKIYPNEEDVVCVNDRPDYSNWLNINELNDEFNRTDKNYYGKVIYLIGYNVDTLENSLPFSITVAPADYREHIALINYLVKNPNAKTVIEKTLKNDPKKYINSAIPSNIAANILVLYGDDYLVVKRSRAEATAKNIWSIGIYETFTIVKDISNDRDDNHLFAQIERGLWEELAIKPTDVEEIYYTWFGMLSTVMRTHFVVIVNLKINESIRPSVAKKRIIANTHKNAISNFESDRLEWLKWKEKEIANFLINNRPIKNRKWLVGSKLALQEISRYRKVR